ncbi:GMC family oxidoreductase [Ensifer sp. MPMI2T]|nr:GMC family oxidoreductase [Ensifer sp. MPMI2T]
MAFDYIIVGGGSSGCVMASRLSAAGEHVLLVEAGPDTPPDAIPDDILDGDPTRAYFNPDYQWPALQARVVRDGRRATHYEQARVVGGGSSINAQVANRGGPDDYNEWAANGATGWGWDEVLPYFRRLETDLDFDGEFHGKDGPLPIKRVLRSNWSGFITAVSEAYEAAGICFRPDFNGEFGDGYSVVPLTNRDGRRVSTAMAYLDKSVRSRPNLKVLPSTTVVRLIFSGNSVAGVEVENSSGRQIFHSANVVLCSGSLHTPAVLMRSGVGPADHLTSLSIPVVAHVPGVGQGLQEHPGIAISGYLEPNDRMLSNLSGHIQMHARYSSGQYDCPPTDMAISAVAKSAWHPLGRRLGSLFLWVNRSYSTGAVTLRHRSHNVEPEVDFNWLSDVRDLTRLKAGFHFLGRLWSHPSLSAVALDPFPSAWNWRAKKISKINRINYGLTYVLAKLMDSSPGLRRSLIKHVITNGQTFSDLLASDALLDRFVRENVTGNWHPTSSCRMGSSLDPMAVTDPSGRVRGISGVRIADASVMPHCPRANTNIPTVMVAEKMADTILRERHRA